MRQRIRFISYLAVLSFVGALPWLVAGAQSAPAASLADQLRAQYKTDTVLVIQKKGITGFPPNSAALVESKYQDGSLRAANGFLAGMVNSNTRSLNVGEKVIPSKIDVNVKTERVSITIVECDSCNGVSQPSSYKSGVIFQFPKGYLESADVGQVEDVIGQVFSIDNGANNAQQDQSAQAQQAPPEQQAPPPQPQTIQLGQTVDQVQAALGQPDKIVNLGSKQIYVYKDIKVTFVNGKVTDAQ